MPILQNPSSWAPLSLVPLTVGIEPYNRISVLLTLSNSTVLLLSNFLERVKDEKKYRLKYRFTMAQQWRLNTKVEAYALKRNEYKGV